MAFRLLNVIKRSINQVGIDITRHYPPTSRKSFPEDFDDAMIDTVLKVRPYTQTSPERLFALCQAVRYVVAHQIPGDIVECGVWRGGSMMAVAHTLLELHDQTRSLYLFDTFEGMTDPTEKDISVTGDSASKLLAISDKKDADSIWCYASLDEVKSAVLSIGYNPAKITFVQGKVEDTIPEQAPANISLLRLDTDWYESTKHELIHLFPRISPGGVIIIDDYGHWQGVRQAVNEYLEANQIRLLLNRIDYTGRIGVVY